MNLNSKQMTNNKLLLMTLKSVNYANPSDYKILA